MNKEIPNNIRELVKMANNKADHKTRLEALEILKNYDCQQTRDIVTNLTLHDKVFKVKEEAFRIAQKLDIKKNGKAIYLGKKDIGYKSKDFKKVFSRVKSETKMEEFDLLLFKDKFKIVNAEMYDVMSYEKGEKFNKWLENMYKGLPKQKK